MKMKFCTVLKKILQLVHFFGLIKYWYLTLKAGEINPIVLKNASDFLQCDFGTKKLKSMAPQPVSAATAAGMPAIAKYSSTDIFVMEGKSKHLLLKEVCLVYKPNNAMNGSREIESV